MVCVVVMLIRTTVSLTCIYLPLQTEEILSAIQNDHMQLEGRTVVLQEELVTMLTEAASTLVNVTAGQDQEGLLPGDLNTTVTFLDAIAR